MSEPGLSFNKIAGDYDRYREAYPIDFIKMVLEVVCNRQPSKICEIGCGTGQATIRLADLGYSILCVEPGSDLLEIVRARLKNYPCVKKR
jgi:16S rRNA A1518/A1519 N6-dimethyltransferase RsmA/KsgA/DIM1 with predicted DNA glycosylase/AP lyase activity